MVRPNKLGTNQNARRWANSAVSSEAAGDASFGAVAFPKRGGSRTGVGSWLSRVAGKVQGAAVYFDGNKPTVLLPCTTSTLHSTTFSGLKLAVSREVQFDDLPHCGADSRQLVFRSGCRSCLRPSLSCARGEAGFDRGRVPLPAGAPYYYIRALAPRRGKADYSKYRSLAGNTISWKGTVTYQ